MQYCNNVGFLDPQSGNEFILREIYSIPQKAKKTIKKT